MSDHQVYKNEVKIRVQPQEAIFLQGEEPFSHPFERSSPGLRGVRDVSWLSSALAAASNQASHASWCFDLKAEIWCATVVSFPLDSSFFWRTSLGFQWTWPTNNEQSLIFCGLFSAYCSGCLDGSVQAIWPMLTDGNERWTNEEGTYLQMVIDFLIPNTQHQFAIGNAFNHLMAVLGPWLANSSRGNGLLQLLLSPATAHAEKNIVDIDICCDQFCKWLELRQTSTTGPALSTFVRASWWFCLPVPLLSQVSVSMEHKLSFGTSSIPIVSSMCLENAPTFHSVFPNYTSFNLEPSKSESNRLGMVLLSQEISRCDNARLNAEIYWRQFPMWITVAWRHASCPFFFECVGSDDTVSNKCGNVRKAEAVHQQVSSWHVHDK